MTNESPMRRITAIAMAGVLALLGFTNAHAQDAAKSPAGTNDAALVDRIKREVLRELMEQGGMDAAIDAGIERFVTRQREARDEAEARQRQDATALAQKVRPVSAQRDHILGNPGASVSLIEYSDFECPFCKRFHSTAKELVATYDGKVNWIYRHFPLASHNPGAQKQAEATECAAALGGNDAFWKYADQIYERTRSNGNGFPLDGLVPLAEEIGLDRAEFRDCVESGRYAARVQEDYEEGIAAGISGTPGNILLNNATGEAVARPGAVPIAVLKQIVDRLLGTAR
jgi:protein-disulfide isomerase